MLTTKNRRWMFCLCALLIGVLVSSLTTRHAEAANKESQASKWNITATNAAGTAYTAASYGGADVAEVIANGTSWTSPEFRVLPQAKVAALEWNVTPASGTASVSVSYLPALSSGAETSAWTDSTGASPAYTSNTNIAANGAGFIVINPPPGDFMKVKFTNNAGVNVTVTHAAIETF